MEASKHNIQIVQVKVRLHCKACEKTVRKALCKIKGVRSIEIERASNKITVLGNMERKAVVKAIWKTGRRAELSSASQPPPHPTATIPFAFTCFIPKCGF